MSGLELRIPYVSYKTKTKGFPYRLSIAPTEMLIQKNFQYYSNKVMLKSSLYPLNTTENDVSWGIIDGSTYATINSSTGELTINENTITQMVKVRAQSKTNPNLYDDREIVLTYKEPEAIEEITFDISVNGLSSEYIFADSSTSYNFTAQLDPSLNGYTVVYDIIEGYDTFYVTDMNFDNNITTTTFSFYPPELEDQIISLHLYVDKIPDISTDVQFTVKTLISEILFDNIPEAPYIPNTLYSFDYYTEPVVNFRNLDVSVITGSEYLYNYYTVDEIGTRGKFCFIRNENEIINDEYIVVRFSDPLDNTIYNDTSFVFENLHHTIDVSGNKSLYQYNQDKTFYESFAWIETPNYNRELEIIVTQEPDNIINYYLSDVSGGCGTFNFQTKDITDEGKVKVRIQDPNKNYIRKDVIFKIRNAVQVDSYSIKNTAALYDSDKDPSVINLITVKNVNSDHNIELTDQDYYQTILLYDTSNYNYDTHIYEYNITLNNTSTNIEYNLNSSSFEYSGICMNTVIKTVGPNLKYISDPSLLSKYTLSVDTSINDYIDYYYGEQADYRNFDPRYPYYRGYNSINFLTNVSSIVLDASIVQGERAITHATTYGDFTVTTDANVNIFDNYPELLNIPHIKWYYPQYAYADDTKWYSFFDPYEAKVQLYFNNKENKEIVCKIELYCRVEDSSHYLDTTNPNYFRWYWDDGGGVRYEQYDYANYFYQKFNNGEVIHNENIVYIYYAPELISFYNGEFNKNAGEIILWPGLSLLSNDYYNDPSCHGWNAYPYLLLILRALNYINESDNTYYSRRYDPKNDGRIIRKAEKGQVIDTSFVYTINEYPDIKWTDRIRINVI